MNKYVDSIVSGESIRFWLFNDFQEEAYVCEKEKDDIVLSEVRKYYTMEQIGSIHYAVRRKYLKSAQDYLKSVDYKEIELEKVYFPLESDAVELTTFFHNPTRLNTYVKTYISCEDQRMEKFQLRNSCYMKMWINGKLADTYYPKTRNTENEQEVLLFLDKGNNEILIYMEDLAERDVFFYFQLTYLGENRVTYFIPISGEQEDVDEKAAVLKSMTLEKDTIFGDCVRVYYDNTLIRKPIEIQLGHNQGAVMFPSENNDKNTFLLKDDENKFNLRIKEIGSHKIQITTQSGNVTVTLNLLISKYSKEYLELAVPLSISQRKKKAMELINAAEKEFPTTLIAILSEQNKLTDRAIRILNESLDVIHNKKDCSDFKLLPVLVAYIKYGHLLTDELKERIKETILNFRYWWDEPGNDVMCFFSENHSLLFHTCRYLAGHIFPNETFSVSQVLGQRQEEKGKKQLLEWINTFLENGFDEWNSVTYIPVDLIAFFSLYITAKDKEILDKVKKALDKTFEIIAGNMFGRKYTAAYARVYEEYMRGTELNELNLIAWIAFGQGMFNLSLQCAPLFCICSYEPPCMEHLSKVKNKSGITIQRKQGANRAHTYLYKTPYYSLATVVNFLAFKPGVQQNVLNIGLGENKKVLWINHPGEKAFSGLRRPSYWAGCGTLPYIYQYKNLAMAVFNIAENHIVDFIHMALPKYQLEKVEKEDNWLFIKEDNSYVGVWFANDFVETTRGMNRNKEIISRGRNNAVIIKCGSVVEHGEFDKFEQSCKSGIIEYDGNKELLFEDKQQGLFEINCTEFYRHDQAEKKIEIAAEISIEDVHIIGG